MSVEYIFSIAGVFTVAHIHAIYYMTLLYHIIEISRDLTSLPSNRARPLYVALWPLRALKRPGKCSAAPLN